VEFLNLAAIECYKFIMHYAESAGLDIIPGKII
jgi:hypothetical protein